MLLCKLFLKGWGLSLCLVAFGVLQASAQYVTIDSVAVQKPKPNTKVLKGKDGKPLKGIDGADSVFVKPKHIPRLATLRSAMVPGWGQWYNHKYWKVPLVYGALIACVVIFEENIQQYKLYRRAYQILGSAQDTSAKALATLPSWILQYSPQDIQYARNEAREYVDYSVLAFILAWGLNVVDATIDAHLQDFDISDNLSLRLKPESNMTGGATGLSLVLDIHQPRKKPSPFLANPY
jgi:hypothetical protein